MSDYGISSSQMNEVNEKKTVNEFLVYLQIPEPGHLYPFEM